MSEPAPLAVPAPETGRSMPQFFLGIGAQKAGTTWLGVYFARHPEVYFSPIKELHFFDAMHGGSQGRRIWHPDFDRLSLLVGLLRRKHCKILELCSLARRRYCLFSRSSQRSGEALSGAQSRWRVNGAWPSSGLWRSSAAWSLCKRRPIRLGPLRRPRG